MKLIFYLWLSLVVLFGPTDLFCQQRDSSTLFRQRLHFGQIYAPALLIVSGISLNGRAEESFKNELAEERDEHIPHFRTRVDNYLQYSPIAIVYGLDALGIRSKTNVSDRTAILFKGELLMTAAVFPLKQLTHRLRPDGSGFNSFPSGHTAQVFAAATFLSEEYKDRFRWMPYASYGIASLVGILRLANNKHYISDVLVGAGIGILSVKISYWTHRYKWNQRKGFR